MEIAAILPVYREPRRIESIVRRLSAEDYPGSAIHVVVDGETTEALAPAIEAIRGLPRVRIVEGQPHLGKAMALTRAIAGIEADAILFLDNDIGIRGAGSLFSRSAALLESCDLAELPKVGRGAGIVASMGRYEFLSNVIATEYLVGKAGRFPSINGAAFVIKNSLFRELGGFRGVVNEDMDLAARAFLHGARFGFDPAMTVTNEVPETVEEWLKQRRRWAINTALWSAVYMERVLRHDPALGPLLGFSGFLFPLPLIALATGALLPLVPASLLGATPLATALCCLGGGLVAFAPVAAWFARHSRRYSSRFNPLTYFLFSVLYLPIWGLASLSGLIAISLGRLPVLDWKHDHEETYAALAEAKAGGRQGRRGMFRRRRGAKGDANGAAADNADDD